MKKILRHYVIDTFCLWTVSQVAKGIVYGKGFETLLLAGVGVTIISIIGKPVINLLLLPLNLVTFGLFRWISSAIILYLVTLIVKDFKIVGFKFAGLTSQWFDIPKLEFSGFLAYVGFSFLFSFLASFIYWLIKK